MKKDLLGLILILLPFSTWPACVGMENFFFCADAAGNTYTVTKSENATIVQGVGARTGRTWSQTSQRLGNTLSSSSMTPNGRTWTELTTIYGWDNRSSVTTGTEPNGNSYTLICTPDVYDGKGGSSNNLFQAGCHSLAVST